ncbi:mannosyltransferase [Rhodococcus sp. X156]|uniref:mannosyltransferase n=1 Tax=Rhodococcus sp. X156 TaxID=2499145 RepID=UPI001F49EB6B|nr:mannosyltransferase [Rhodococcus sp. X156]
MRLQQVMSRALALVQSHWWLAPLVLLVSGASRLVLSFVTRTGLNMVDLRVYSFGAQSLERGELYTFTFSEMTPNFPLPFTYPPFAALLFFPLHYVPITALAVLWLVVTMVALWGVVRLSLTLLLGAERSAEPFWRNAAMLWAAVGIWMEPVRTTLDYGQVNVFLVLGGLAAATTSRWWLAGGIVGVLAGVKLTPAITGLYFLAQRRYLAAVFSAVAFAATIAISFLAIPDATRTYFGELLGKADRIGPVGSAINQSLRGVLSRFAGHDVGTGPVWVVAVLLAAALCVCAWRGLAADDRLGTLVIVQLFGLLVSPISWSHHWVWLVPAVLWLAHGPLRQTRLAFVASLVWVVVMLIGVIALLLLQQPSIWEFERPLLESISGAIYPAGTAFILVLMGLQRRLVRPRPAVPQPAVPAPRPVA